MLSADYLEFGGGYSAGGRQRHIRDLAKVITEDWGRDVHIIQRAAIPFEVRCPAGYRVTGLKTDLRAWSGWLFALRARRLIEPGDGVLYASGEEAWPVFEPEGKAIQHGIWWDGPQRPWVAWVQRQRAVMAVSGTRQTLCVDTNFINWLRGQGPRGYELCSRCTYIPNYADLDALHTRDPDHRAGLRLICARRFEEKRGTLLFLEALRLLQKRGVSFTAHIATSGGRAIIDGHIDALGLRPIVTVSEDSMDEVLARYASADVAVVPTRWSEGTSLAAVEAICAGLPVVATPVGGLGNLIVPGFNGLLVAPTAEALAEGIARFENRAQLEAMGRNCLSMREALSFANWRSQLVSWLQS